MTDDRHKALYKFLRDFVLRPVMSQRLVLATIFVSLLLLALTQASFLVLVKGFLAAFFTDTSKDSVSFASLLPASLQVAFPQIAAARLERSEFVILIPFAILLAGFIKAAASYVYNLGVVRLSLKVAQNYREIVFQAVLTLPWLDSARRSPGEWMSVIMADAVFIQARLADFSTAFIKDGVLILSCLVTLAFIHWPAALVLLLVSPFIAWQMGRAGKRISWYTEAFQRELGVLSGQLLGIRERFRFMRAQHGEGFEIAQFRRKNLSYLSMMNGSIFIRAIVAPGMEWIGFLIFSGFIYAWTRKISGFTVEPGEAIQFFVALGLILKPVRELGEQVARWSETIGGLRRSMEVVQGSHLTAEHSFAAGSVGHNTISKLPGSIQISHIEVTYGGRRALNASDLTLRRGTSVAVIGPSGSGKSTLIKSLAGLIRPAIWESDYDWRSLVSSSALVSQQPFLFKDSLVNNLVYGLSPEQRNSLTEAEIMSALATVNLADWIVSEQRSLDSEFNPVQTSLSGGQIQRLVIARAILRQPDVLLLDEATSAVDAATEQDISERLIAKNRDRNGLMLAVTHRLRWLGLYDEVWFVEDGKLVFKGRHQDLMSNDRYRAFCTSGGE